MATTTTMRHSLKTPYQGATELSLRTTVDTNLGRSRNASRVFSANDATTKPTSRATNTLVPNHCDRAAFCVQKLSQFRGAALAQHTAESPRIRSHAAASAVMHDR